MRGRTVLPLLMAAAALVGPPPRPAHAAPDLAIQFGRAFAVGSEIDGAFDQGGPHVAASLLWPWDNRFRFGVMAFGTDLGDLVESVTLVDGRNVRYYGSVERGHLDAWGFAWRTDVLGPRLGGVGTGTASLSYGFVRLEADEVGTVHAATSAVEATLAFGIERPLSPRHTLALTAGGTWLSDDFTKHYGSAALEWRWQWRAPEPAARP